MALTPRELKLLAQTPVVMAEHDDPFADPVPPVSFASVSRMARSNFRRLVSSPSPVVAPVPAQAAETPMLRRFRLQCTARHLLPSHRVAGCLRYKVPGKEGVPIYFSPGSGVSSYGNLQVCGSVWACPVCSAKITEKRRVALAAHVALGRALGKVWIMVTYTVQHGPADSLQWLLKGIKAGKKRGGLNGARSVALGGRHAQEIYWQFGVLGSIRAKEVTWGHKSGWHPHIHELLLVEPGCDIPGLLAALSARWACAVGSVGLRAVNEHGVKISEAHHEIEQYVAKWGHEPKWSYAEELSKQVVKQGREGRYSPLQLLARYSETGDVELGERWREYAQTMKGERQLYYSPRILAFLKIAKQATDKEVVEQHDQPGLQAFCMEDADLQNVCFSDVRGEFLSVISTSCKKHEVTLTLTSDVLTERLRLVGADARAWLSDLLPRDADALVHASRPASVLRPSRLLRRPSAEKSGKPDSRDLSGHGWEHRQDLAASEWSQRVTDYNEWGGPETGMTLGEFMEWRSGGLEK